MISLLGPQWHSVLQLVDGYPVATWINDRIEHPNSASCFVYRRFLQAPQQMGVMHDFSKPRQDRARGCSGYGQWLKVKHIGGYQEGYLSVTVSQKLDELCIHDGFVVLDPVGQMLFFIISCLCNMVKKLSQ